MCLARLAIDNVRHKRRVSKLQNLLRRFDLNVMVDADVAKQRDQYLTMYATQIAIAICLLQDRRDMQPLRRILTLLLTKDDSWRRLYSTAGYILY